jgi:hypothetical protein
LGSNTYGLNGDVLEKAIRTALIPLSLPSDKARNEAIQAVFSAFQDGMRKGYGGENSDSGKADVVLMIKGNTFMKTEIEVGDLVNVRKSAFTPHLKHVMKVYGIKIKRKGHKVTKIYSPSIYGSTAYVIDNGKMVLFDDDVE